MASKQQNGFFYTAIMIMITIMGLNFFVLMMLVGVQYKFGKVSEADLKNIGYVLLGKKHSWATEEQENKYKELLEKEKEWTRIEAEEGGDIETRRQEAKALAAEIERFNAQRALNRDEMSLLQNNLDQTRAEIEALKVAAEEERKKLEALQNERVKVSLSKSEAYQRKLLGAMDTARVGLYLTGVAQGAGPDGGPGESARLVREYLNPQVAAEVMDELEPAVMQQILPLTRNKYAGMAPDEIVKLWTTPGTDDYKNPSQMSDYMKHMSVSQAFKVFTLLDASTRAEVERLLRM